MRTAITYVTTAYGLATTNAAIPCGSLCCSRMHLLKLLQILRGGHHEQLEQVRTLWYPSPKSPE